MKTTNNVNISLGCRIPVCNTYLPMGCIKNMYLSNLLLIVSNWTHSRLNRELWFTMALNSTFGLYNIYMCWTRIPPLIIYVQWYILCVRIYKRYFLKILKIDEMATSMQPWERERDSSNYEHIYPNIEKSIQICVFWEYLWQIHSWKTNIICH